MIGHEWLVDEDEKRGSYTQEGIRYVHADIHSSADASQVDKVTPAIPYMFVSYESIA